MYPCLRSLNIFTAFGLILLLAFRWCASLSFSILPPLSFRAPLDASRCGVVRLLILICMQRLSPAVVSPSVSLSVCLCVCVCLQIRNGGGGGCGGRRGFGEGHEWKGGRARCRCSHPPFLSLSMSLLLCAWARCFCCLLPLLLGLLPPPLHNVTHFFLTAVLPCFLSRHARARASPTVPHPSVPLRSPPAPLSHLSSLIALVSISHARVCGCLFSIRHCLPALAYTSA